MFESPVIIPHPDKELDDGGVYKGDHSDRILKGTTFTLFEKKIHCQRVIAFFLICYKKIKNWLKFFKEIILNVLKIYF